MWHEGVIGAPVNGEMIACKYWVKAFPEPSSEWGIDGGRISKLAIQVNGKWTCNYDRGWDIEPEDEATQIAYMILLQEYN